MTSRVEIATVWVIAEDEPGAITQAVEDITFPSAADAARCLAHDRFTDAERVWAVSVTTQTSFHAAVVR